MFKWIIIIIDKKKKKLLESNEGVTLGFVSGGFEGVEVGVVYFLVRLNNPALAFLPNLGIIFMMNLVNNETNQLC